METCDSNKTLDQLAKGKYSSASWSFVVIFVPLAATFGVICNLAFMFVVYRVKSMRNITNVYLVNLAIADSLLLLIAVWQYIGDYIVSPVYDLRFSFSTTFACFMPNLLIYLCYYASLWTVTLVSIERYLAICHPFWHRLVSSKTRAIRLVIAVWLVSLIFSGFALPYNSITICVVSVNQEIIKSIPYCEFYCSWCAFALYLTDVLQFIIALIINIIMYVLVVIKLTKKTLPSEDNTNHLTEAHNKTRNAVAKMLIINGAVFFICLFPFIIANIDSIINFFGYYPFNTQFIYPIGWASRVLFLVNSAVNSLIYNATNPRYRSAFRSALFCQGKEQYKHGRFFRSQYNVTKLTTSYQNVKSGIEMDTPSGYNTSAELCRGPKGRSCYRTSSVVKGSSESLEPIQQ